uniref:Uncharacterized protein n=1 Tax=Knipowitschia caucasica TaxID=637954 RepID=A0AAV2L9E4_KNICA
MLKVYSLPLERCPVTASGRVSSARDRDEDALLKHPWDTPSGLSGRGQTCALYVPVRKRSPELDQRSARCEAYIRRHGSIDL